VPWRIGGETITGWRACAAGPHSPGPVLKIATPDTDDKDIRDTKDGKDKESHPKVAVLGVLAVSAVL
jgi:hypothetical protein